MQVWMLLLGRMLLVSHGATLPPTPSLMTPVMVLRMLVLALLHWWVLILSGTSSLCYLSRGSLTMAHGTLTLLFPCHG